MDDYRYVSMHVTTTMVCTPGPMTIPALYHDVVDVPRAAGGREETETTVHFPDDLMFGVSLKRLVPETPYLVHHTTKAPHIT